MGYGASATSAAMQHGLDLEPAAKEAYRKHMVSSHGNDFKAVDSGLIISQTHPFIAASPDLHISCKCHGEGLCEIKCPSTIRDEVPSHSNYEHISAEGTLKRTSPYYFQIMVQLGVTGLSYCDFFVFTSAPSGQFVDRVYFDEELRRVEEKTAMNSACAFLYIVVKCFQ